ncbi:hypothetical protein ACFL2B_02765 [Patescibacteria group bacterium]
MSKNVKIIIVLVVLIGAGAALFTLFASDLGFTGLSISSKPTVSSGCGDPNVCNFPDECDKCPECDCECKTDSECIGCDGNDTMVTQAHCEPNERGSTCVSDYIFGCSLSALWDEESQCCVPSYCDEDLDHCHWDPDKELDDRYFYNQRTCGQEGYLQCNCGDGSCNPDWENIDNCPEDCHCGNGICEPDLDETRENCPDDCEYCDFNIPGGCDRSGARWEYMIWVPGAEGGGRCADPMCDMDAGVCVPNLTTGWTGDDGFMACHCGNGICEGIEEQGDGTWCWQDCPRE